MARMEPTHLNGLTADTFKDLVRMVGPELRLYCRRLANNVGSLGDDILQVTFLAAWETRDRFTGGNARAWLFTIARLKGLELLRSEGKYRSPPALFVLGEHSRLEETPSESDATALVLAQRCKQQLEPLDATIVEGVLGLRPAPEGMDGSTALTYQEVSVLLREEHAIDYSANRIRVRFQRAIQFLLKCLEAALCRQTCQESLSRWEALVQWRRLRVSSRSDSHAESVERRTQHDDMLSTREVQS